MRVTIEVIDTRTGDRKIVGLMEIRAMNSPGFEEVSNYTVHCEPARKFTLKRFRRSRGALELVRTALNKLAMLHRREEEK